MRTFVALLAMCSASVLCSGVARGQPPDRSGEMLQGKVVAYSSGTAFAILDETEKLRRIKLTGIDAPERRQKFAAEARRLAAEWLGRGTIRIAIDGHDPQYARSHGRVRVDGRDVGLVLIEAGLVWCDPNDEAMLPDATREAYRTACKQARSSRRGLWQDADPSPPWEYRRIPEFDPLPKQQNSGKTCRDIGYQSVQCDDGTRYRTLGGETYGSDGSVYSRRGRTITGEDGTSYVQQGNSTYGSDGTVCRIRGRQINCY